MNEGGCAASVFLVVVCAVIVFAGWRVWGFENGRLAGAEEVRKEAVELGHAHYIIADPKTGAVEFRWKEEK